MTNLTTIQPDISMRELLEVYPGAQRALFRKYHIGGCASCGFQPTETLAQVCARNENLPVEAVIEYLAASHEEDLKTQIAPAELAALLGDNFPQSKIRNPKSPRLVDIRTREEFDAARIDGSVLFTQDLMQEILTKWDRAALVVFVDHQGKRSMDAAAYFSGHGFENAKSLRGGIDAWSIEVDPAIPRYHLE